MSPAALRLPPPQSSAPGNGSKAFHNQAFARAIGFRNQVKIALQLEPDAALGVLCDQRTGFPGDLSGGSRKEAKIS